MQRTLTLASKGLGYTMSNPMVGCVIVYQGKIIGEGYHQRFGEAHAEVNAIHSVENKELLKQSTLYVNLEPCAHSGKTPPCSHLIVEMGIPKVVFGSYDPNPLVNGKGVQYLKNKGVDVIGPVLENECKELNKRFFIYQQEKRPYIILKWAETANGKLNGDFKQISGKMAGTMLHQWRSEEQAIMVGTNTLLEDNPQLNARNWNHHNPIRITFDRHLSNQHPSLHFFDLSQETIVFHVQSNDEKKLNGIKYIQLPDFEVKTVLSALHQLGISSLIVEGGSKLLQSFIDEGLHDEIRVFKSKQLESTSGMDAPKIHTSLKNQLDLGQDVLLIY